MTEDDRKMTEKNQNWTKRKSGFNAENKRSLKIKLGYPPSSCAGFLCFAFDGSKCKDQAPVDLVYGAFLVS